MTKIEEILEKYKTKTDYYADQEWDYGSVKQALIEYAEWYAKKVLELAAENATLLDDGKPTQQQRIIWEAYNTSRSDVEFEINKESITNIQLPAHE